MRRRIRIVQTARRIEFAHGRIALEELEWRLQYHMEYDARFAKVPQEVHAAHRRIRSFERRLGSHRPEFALRAIRVCNHVALDIEDHRPPRLCIVAGPRQLFL